MNTTEQRQQITIRRMGDNDLKAAAELEQAVFSRPWSYESLKEAVHNVKNCYLCACAEGEMGGQLVGYCGFWNVADEGQIYNVAVDARYRHQGIARRLLIELFGYGRQAGIKSYTLEVRKSNTDAIQLYEHLGFRAAGTRKNFYDAPKEDAIIMNAMPAFPISQMSENHL